MKVLTAEMLESRGACGSDVQHFREVFPDGCKLTLVNARKALEEELDLSWVVYYLFCKKAQDFLVAKDGRIYKEHSEERKKLRELFGDTTPYYPARAACDEEFDRKYDKALLEAARIEMKEGGKKWRRVQKR